MNTEEWFEEIIDELKDDLYFQICGLEFEINEKRLDNQGEKNDRLYNLAHESGN